MIGRIVAVAALLSAPVLGLAQDRLAGRLPEPARAAVAELVDSARTAGLPTDPLLNRALEGAAKGADGERIIAAVRSLAARLGEARAALGASATEAELVAGAAAVRAGASAAFLARLRREAPREPLVVPLAVMADLVARGVPADTAATSVLTLVRSGARDADLVAFRENVERDIALGAAAGASATARTGADASALSTAGTPTTTGTPSVPRKP